jgi:DNA-binding PucR family transcriptional regulator
VWSDADDEIDDTQQLDRAGARVAEVLRGTESLIVPAGRSVLYGWVGSSRRHDGVIAHLDIDGVHVCVGSPRKGVAGFRRTHDQAGLARRVARLSTPVPAFLDYRDCAVVALLCDDVDRGREFVAVVLGGTLERDDADRLLDTVSVYQHEGLSLSRAAERLHVHRNTVAYRVRRVVEASTENDGGSLHLRAAVELAKIVGPVADGGHRREA